MSSRLTNLQNPKFLVSFHEVAGSLIGSRQVTDVPLKKLGGGTAQRCNLWSSCMMFLTGLSNFAMVCCPCGMSICLQSSMAQDVEGALKEQQCEMAEMRSKLMRKERGQSWYSWLRCVALRL